MTYYTNAKRTTIGGVPCKVPKWYNELGNDKEALNGIRPRQFAPEYYEGAHRMVIDGIPYRCASHVKGWKSGNKASLCKGSASYREGEALKAQIKLLFSPVTGES